MSVLTPTAPLSAHPSPAATPALAEPSRLSVVVEFPGAGDARGERVLAVLGALKELVGPEGTVAVSPATAGAASLRLTPAADRAAKPRRVADVDDGRIRIYPHAQMVLRGSAHLGFSRREFALLHFLASHPGRVFTRDQLLRQVWGTRNRVGKRTVDVHVRRLRAKLSEHSAALITVHGVGYRLDVGAGVLLIEEPTL